MIPRASNKRPVGFAPADAICVIREMLAHELAQGQVNLCRAFEIACADGKVLDTVRLASAVHIAR